jgi:hypothetical protein
MTFDASCFKNSLGAALHGGPLTAASLTSAVVNGTATGGGSDTVSLSDGRHGEALLLGSGRWRSSRPPSYATPDELRSSARMPIY